MIEMVYTNEDENITLRANDVQVRSDEEVCPSCHRSALLRCRHPEHMYKTVDVLRCPECEVYFERKGAAITTEDVKAFHNLVPSNSDKS